MAHSVIDGMTTCHDRGVMATEVSTGPAVPLADSESGTPTSIGVRLGVVVGVVDPPVPDPGPAGLEPVPDPGVEMWLGAELEPGEGVDVVGEADPWGAAADEGSNEVGMLLLEALLEGLEALLEAVVPPLFGCAGRLGVAVVGAWPLEACCGRVRRGVGVIAARPVGCEPGRAAPAAAREGG